MYRLWKAFFILRSKNQIWCPPATTKIEWGHPPFPSIDGAWFSSILGYYARGTTFTRRLDEFIQFIGLIVGSLMSKMTTSSRIRKHVWLIDVEVVTACTCIDGGPKAITQASNDTTRVRRLLLSVPTHSDKSDSTPKASGSTAPPHRPLLRGQISEKNFHLDNCFVVGTPSMQESSRTPRGPEGIP